MPSCICFSAHCCCFGFVKFGSVVARGVLQIALACRQQLTAASMPQRFLRVTIATPAIFSGEGSFLID